MRIVGLCFSTLALVACGGATPAEHAHHVQCCACLNNSFVEPGGFRCLNQQSEGNHQCVELLDEQEPVYVNFTSDEKNTCLTVACKDACDDVPH
jgi:hypothetical protein